jgi:hypothetical protein
MLVTIYDLEPSKSTLVYVGASLGFILATPIAGILMSRKLVNRRLITYAGFWLIIVGMVIRTGDFGDEPMLGMSIAG